MADSRIDSLFATRLYRAQIRGLDAALEKTCLALARDDHAGRRWAREHGYKGYTSYASLDDLVTRASVFAELATHIGRHVKRFARALDFDLAGHALELDSLWANVMERGSIHTGHIHPHSAISGTYYVSVPPAAAAIRFEDPRLPLMMAAPPKKKRAKEANKSFVNVAPKAGTLLLWESFVRHEVIANSADGKRISISFNYAWTKR